MGGGWYFNAGHPSLNFSLGEKNAGEGGEAQKVSITSKGGNCIWLLY